ncbi:hypothetical protein NLG97_g2951 [Lecanicillium saksenae]|uniref:Uncharacterized protein n=1 Tax=Lecanicillium saksenae TaxID=468837 RepID=A0ACC1QZF6_9HYPO|nr:hypothetical protein NLG97_g2951 [Lecanicillium saksenae]
MDRFTASPQSISGQERDSLGGRGSTTTQSDSEASQHNSENDQQRKRRWAPKVKTGCATCRQVVPVTHRLDESLKLSRQRRIKCDENRPVCKKCISGRRVCRGYMQISHVSFVKSSTKPVVTMEPSPPMSPGEISQRPNEIDLFHYFRAEVVPEMAGAFDQEYWMGNLLRQAQAEPIVWHACNAIAAVHKLDKLEIYGASSLAGEQKSLSLQPTEQYIAAIQQMGRLTKRDSLTLEQKRDIVLVSLLFTVLSFIRGDIQDCNLHTASSFKLIESWKLWEQTRLYRSRDKHSVHTADSLIYFCVRIETMGSHLRKPDHFYDYFWEGCSLKLRDDPFISLTEAYFELELICNAGTDITVRPGPKRVKFTDDEIQAAEGLRGRYRDRLAKWEGKFRDFAWSCLEGDRLAVAILELRAAMMRRIVFTEDALTVSETCWDSSAAEFARLIGLAKEILAWRYAALGQDGNNPHGHKSRHGGRTMSVGPMVNETLYLIARLCRDPIVRRQAIALLAHDFHLSPGIDTLLYIFMASAIRDQEEREWNKAHQFRGVASVCGCSRVQHVICDDHRICTSCLDGATRNSAVLWVKTVDDVNRDEAWRKIPMQYGSYHPELTPLSEI